jgi:hypothetical protein
MIWDVFSIVSLNAEGRGNWRCLFVCVDKDVNRYLLTFSCSVLLSNEGGKGHFGEHLVEVRIQRLAFLLEPDAQLF